MSLAPISDPDLVIPTIAQTLDVRETTGWSLLEQLTASLREKQVLLLLDNFEQVVSAATQVADLLSYLSAAQSAGHEPGGAACASRA